MKARPQNRHLHLYRTSKTRRVSPYLSLKAQSLEYPSTNRFAGSIRCPALQDTPALKRPTARSRVLQLHFWRSEPYKTHRWPRLPQTQAVTLNDPIESASPAAQPQLGSSCTSDVNLSFSGMYVGLIPDDALLCIGSGICTCQTHDTWLTESVKSPRTHVSVQRQLVMSFVAASCSAARLTVSMRRPL